MKQQVIISKQFKSDLAKAIAECEHDRIFILVDETTKDLCWDLIKDYYCLKGAQVITIGTTDSSKTLETLTHVWESLQQGGATRIAFLLTWRWYGDGSWWLCSLNLQTWNQLYQCSYDSSC